MNPYRVYLDGKGLQDIDPSIIITSVVEEAPEMEISTAGNAKYNGLRLLNRKRNKLTVKVTLAFREIANVARRAELLDEVRAWCENGGDMTVNYRNGQRLRVVCVTPPALGAVRAWTTPIEISFSAFANPFWEDTTPSIYAPPKIAKALEFSVTPNGTADYAFCESVITCTDTKTLTKLKIECDETFFDLNGLYLTNGQKFEVHYNAFGFLSMTANGQSALHRRTAASSDDLIAHLRKANQVKITADAAVQAKIMIRGVYV